MPYVATGNPGNRTPGSSATIRAEFALIAAAIGALPDAASLGAGAYPVSNGVAFVPATALNGLPIGNLTPSTGAFTTLAVSGGIAASSSISSTAYEGLRMIHNGAYLCGQNAANTARTGYLQFNASGTVLLAAEGPATAGLLFSTVGGSLAIAQSGAAAFSGPVTGASFNGKLATSNISQFTNDAGYITTVGASAASALTGTTLATGVTASSLTSLGSLTALNVSGPATFSGAAISVASEAFRLVNSGGYIAGFNTANTARTGYLQLNAGGEVVLSAEAAAAGGLRFNTTGGTMLMTQLGVATFTGPVNAPSFNGKLATANVSQWTNDSSYLSAMGNAPTVTMSAGRTDAAAYPIVWGPPAATSQMYSCAAVTITSSTGTINCSNLVASGDVTISSDIRGKANIQVIQNAMLKICHLRGVTYMRTDKASHGRRGTGVIAQEVRSVLPEAVVEDDQGMLSVAYGNVVGLLIEGLKDLYNDMQTLKAAA